VLVFPYVDLCRAYALLGDEPRTRDMLARLRRRDGTHHRLSVHRLGLWRGAPYDYDPAPPDEFSRNTVFNSVMQSALAHGTLGPDEWAFLDGRVTDAFYGRRAKRLFQQIRAEVAAVTGDAERVRDSVEGSVAEGLVDLAWIDRCPVFTAYRHQAWWGAARDAVHRRVAPIVDAYAARELEQ
jgi:serine/threonine-protein kinase